MNILQTIGAGIASLGIFIGGLFGFTPESDPIAYAPEEEALGADTVHSRVQVYHQRRHRSRLPHSRYRRMGTLFKTVICQIRSISRLNLDHAHARSLFHVLQ